MIFPVYLLLNVYCMLVTFLGLPLVVYDVELAPLCKLVLCTGLCMFVLFFLIVS